MLSFLLLLFSHFFGGGKRESWSNRKVRKKETSPPLRLCRVCKERVTGGIVVAGGTFLGSYEVNSGAGGWGVRLLLIKQMDRHDPGHDLYIRQSL